MQCCIGIEPMLKSSASCDVIVVTVHTCKHCSKSQSASDSIVRYLSAAVAHTGVANHDAIAAAKGAVAGLTTGASATYAPHKIRINCIAPGLVRSRVVLAASRVITSICLTATCSITNMSLCGLLASRSSRYCLLICAILLQSPHASAVQMMQGITLTLHGPCCS